MKRLLTYTTLLLLLLLTVSCGHKELTYSGPGEVMVHFDWSQHIDVYPESMLLYVYTQDGLEHPFAYPGREGGQITLPEGRHRMVCLNNDTENILTRGDSWENFEVYTRGTQLYLTSALFAGRRAVPRAANTENEPVILEPDMVYTGIHTGVDVSSYAKQDVTIPMTTPVHTYNFIIRNVSNLKYVSGLTATVSGRQVRLSPHRAQRQPPTASSPLRWRVTTSQSSPVPCVPSATILIPRLLTTS